MEEGKEEEEEGGGRGRRGGGGKENFKTRHITCRVKVTEMMAAFSSEKESKR